MTEIDNSLIWRNWVVSNVILFDFLATIKIDKIWPMTSAFFSVYFNIDESTSPLLIKWDQFKINLEVFLKAR